MGIQIEHDGCCVILTLDWPERRNALPPEAAQNLIDLMREETAKESVKALVLTGNGAFCAGGDLRGMLERKDMPAHERRAMVYSVYQGLIKTLLDLPVATFAALDGAAVGLGTDLALACDWRFLGPAGWLRQGWGGLGILPGTGGELLLRWRAPNALWQILPGQRKVDAALADKLGIAEAAEPTALEVAITRGKALEPMDRKVVELYTKLYRADLITALDPYLQAILEHQLPLLGDPAFAEKAQASLSGGAHRLTSPTWQAPDR